MYLPLEWNPFSAVQQTRKIRDSCLALEKVVAVQGMLFWLKKILTIPLLPLYISLLWGLAGVALLWTKRYVRPGRLFVTVGVAVLLVASNKLVSTLLLRPLELRYPAIPEARSASELPHDVAHAAAIVVLGGGHADAPGLSRVNQLSNASMARITEAVRLVRLLPQTKLVVSGHHIKELSHAQVLAEAAASLGIPPERIVRLDDPRDTEDEIHEVAKRFGEAPVVIVTSAWHLPRAMQLCGSMGVKGVPCPTGYMLRPDGNFRSQLLSWNLEALEGSTKAIHEYVGAVWLKLRGK